MKVRVEAPATVANLVCGFDILGMAVDAPFDIMEVKLVDEPGIRIKHEDDYGLLTEPENNVAGVALMALMEGCEKKDGFEGSINKQIKTGRGLGSNAAS